MSPKLARLICISDPWWIFTCISLLWNIKRRYDFSLTELIRVSPRFGVLMGAMVLSVGFIIVDILSVTRVIGGAGSADGINPYWKLAFVFKCLTDTVILDDFRTALDRIKQHRLNELGTLGADDLGMNGATYEGDRLRNVNSRAKRSDEPLWTENALPKSTNWEADIERMDWGTNVSAVASHLENSGSSAVA